MPRIVALPVGIEVVLQLVATLVLFFVLRHFLFKPVTELLNKRKEAIEKEINDAKTGKEEALKLKESYEVKIQEAKKEGHEIIEASRKRGEELREEIVENANNEARGIIEKAKREMDSEREKAVDDLKNQVVTIAMMAASKVVEENLDADSHKKMINKFIDEVGESTWQN